MSESTSKFSFFHFFSLLILSTAIDTLEPNQQITDGEFLISSGDKFCLGFFRPGNSPNRYVGIWFNDTSVLTAVWVANRQTPLTDSNGVLTVTNRGLMLLNGNGTVVWSSGSNSTESSENLVVQLLDSGNLVMRETNEMNSERYTWQSFDHPTNILLAGMKLGRNNVTGVERHLSSWTSADDPSVGNYTVQLVPTGFPQLVVERDSRKVYVTGPWNGFRFSGLPNLQPNPYYSFVFVFNREEAYYQYNMIDDDAKMIFKMALNGEVQRLIWSDRIQDWTVYLKLQVDNCDSYNSCGGNGYCTINDSPQCGCLEKFEPRNLLEWNQADWSSGCVREKPLDCQNGDGFARYRNVKLPDPTDSWYDRSMSLEECGRVCLRNCSCMAYSRLDIRARTGCLLWFGDLIDIREFAEGGQEIYIRLASSEVGGSSTMKRTIYAVSFSLLVAFIIFGLSVILYLRKKKKNKEKKKRAREEMLEHIGQSQSQEPSAVQESTNDNEDLELPLFDYITIVNATDNFSPTNKIGEGGFGPVYKGVLKDGNEIAVKKLSKSSRQGIDEFKNEVLCITKLQHRNLVKLLGCCIQVETILVYEYMPNNSLDYFIFDEKRSALLDWPMLFNIINGISRGLLYLHQDSRLRIIHRDLKASNILLDHEMNPKISDFGMARSFRGNETEANTTRVVGTYGYMSPEYAVDGIFSVKSDVFSFGVLVLEIVSGKKNRGFYRKEHYLNLLGHAWMLHNEGRSVELMNKCVSDSCDEFEVLRSIHVGLLCVQQFPEDRPSMSTVVLMLSSVGELPQPKQPGFFTERIAFDTNSSLYDSASINDFTGTLVQPR